jgi:hypothetical protein
MKTTMKLLAIVLLALPTTMHGQNYEGAIDKAFEKILNTKGISHSTIRDEHHESTGDVEEKTIIYNITVGRPNFKLFDELKEAFLAEEDGKTSVYTCFGPLEDSYRQQWAVKLKRGGDFRVGQKSGSSYAIATFDDPKRKGYRLVHTAEWWDTDDENIKQGVLLSSYGEKPTTQSYSAQVEWQDIRPWLNGSAKIIDMQKYLNMADSLVKLRTFSTDSLMKLNILSHRSDATKDPQEWMRQAISNATNLDGPDWMRLFGLLTQKMLDRADKESSEDLVVAAGIILDMCKNAEDVDNDEKSICVVRLKDVATKLQSRSQYVHDLLMLAAKKLQKNK